VLVVCLEEGLKERILGQMQKTDISRKERVLLVNLKEALNVTYIKGLTA